MIKRTWEPQPHRRLMGRVAILLMKSPLLLICICLNFSDWGKRKGWMKKEGKGGKGREPYFEIRRRKWVSNEMKRSEFLIKCVCLFREKTPFISVRQIKLISLSIIESSFHRKIPSSGNKLNLTCLGTKIVLNKDVCLMRMVVGILH